MSPRLTPLVLWLLPLLVFSGLSTAQPLPAEEYAARREALMDQLADGLLLLHARTAEKAMEQPGWVQDASFLYFTGLVNLPGALLVLDGPRREAWLFVPPAPQSFGMLVPALALAPGPGTAADLGLTGVAPWDKFAIYLDTRLQDGAPKLYLDGPRRPEPTGMPEGFRPVTGTYALWQQSLAEAFPEARFASAYEMIRRLRWVKSRGEVDLLRQNAQATASALRAGMAHIRPGVSQRAAEVAVVAGCIEAGAQGPSFWPWTMSGPNTKIDQLVRAFFDYEHLNRQMQAGELVRVDVGCGGHSYGGDVGRTVPVSGTFSPEQREIWNLLVAAYQAGLAAVRPGVHRDAVFAASRAEIARRRATLETPAARAAAAQMLDPDQGVDWHLHGVGLESGEAAFEELALGSVFAYEPMFTFGAEAYYLEDMIAVTATGYEVLSAGLPYTATEIERAMQGL